MFAIRIKNALTGKMGFMGRGFINGDPVVVDNKDHARSFSTKNKAEQHVSTYLFGSQQPRVINTNDE